MSEQELQNSEADIGDRQASKLEAALLDQSSTVDPKESDVARLETSTNRSPAHSTVGDMNQSPATDTSPLVTTNTAQSTADVDQPTGSDPNQFASKDANASSVSGSSEEFGSVETTETNLEEQDHFESPVSSGGASQTASALDETGASNPEVDEQNGSAAGDSGAHHLTDAAAERNMSVPQTAAPVGDSRASANPGAKNDRQNIPSVGLPVLEEDPTAEEEEEEEEEERAKDNSVKAAAEPKTTKAAESIILIEPPSEEDFDVSLEPNPVDETPSERGKDSAQSGNAGPVKPEARRQKKTSGVEGSRDPVEQTADKTKGEANQVKRAVTLKRTAGSEKGATRETAATRSAKNGSAVKAEENEPLFTVGETEPQSESSQKESPTKGKKSRARRVRSPRRGDEIQATSDSRATNPKKRHQMTEDRNGRPKSGMAEGPGRESSQPREAGRWMAQSPHPPAFRHFAGREDHDTRAVTRSNQKARNLQVWQTMKRFTYLGQVASTSDIDRYQNVRLDFLYRLVEFVSNLCLAGTEVILGRSAVHQLDIFLANVLRSILSSGKLLRRTCLYHGGVMFISDFWRSRVGRPIIRATGYLARSVENVLTVVDEMYVELGLTPGETETIREQGLVKLAVRAWCFPAYCYVYFWAMLLNLVHSSQLYFRDTLPRKLHSRKRRFHDTQYDQDEFWTFTFGREDRSDDDDQEGGDYGSLRRRQGGRKDGRPGHQWTGNGQSGDRQHAEGPERSEERRGEGTQRGGYPERDSSETHRSAEGKQQTETSSDLRRRHWDCGKSHGYHGKGIKTSGQRSVEKDSGGQGYCGYCGDPRPRGPDVIGSVDSGRRQRTDDHGGCSGYAWLPRHKLLSGYYPEPWKTRSGRPIRGRTDESETNSEHDTPFALEREYEYILRSNHAIAELLPVQKRDWYTIPEPLKQCDMECCQSNPPRSSARTSPMRAITKAEEVRPKVLLRAKGARTSTPQKHDARSESARKPRSTFERDYDKGDDFYEEDVDVLCSDNDVDYMTISVDRDVRTVTVPGEDEEEQMSGHYYRLGYPVKKEARDVHDSDEEEAHVSKPGEEDGRTPSSQPKVSFRSDLAHKPPKPAPGRDNQDHEDVPATRDGVKEANSSKGRKITPIKRRLTGARGATSPRPFRLLVAPSSYEATKFEDLSVGNQLLCLMRKMPLLSNVLRDPRDPPPVSYLYDVPTVIRDDDTRRLLEMAPRRRTSKELKRKLEEVYPEDASDDPDYQPEDLDTTDPLEYTEADAAGVSDEEEYVTHIVDVEVHAEAEPARGRPRNRDDDDESDGVKSESEGSDESDILPENPTLYASRP